MNMEFLKLYLFALIGRTARYHYGGDDPIQGFDCSGLVIESLIAMGVLPHGFDASSQGLYDKFSQAGTVGVPSIGALAFYGKSLREISHVAICLDENLMVEAGGGDSTTVDQATAIKKNAFVRMRPIRYRKDFLVTVKPNYLTRGL